MKKPDKIFPNKIVKENKQQQIKKEEKAFALYLMKNSSPMGQVKWELIVELNCSHNLILLVIGYSRFYVSSNGLNL